MLRIPCPDESCAMPATLDTLPPTSGTKQSIYRFVESNGMLVSPFTMNVIVDGSGHNQFQYMILALYSRDWGGGTKNISVSINNSTTDSNLELPNWQSSCSVCWQQIKQKIKSSHLQHRMYKDKWKISCKSHKYLPPPTAIHKNINSQFQFPVVMDPENSIPCHLHISNYRKTIFNYSSIIHQLPIQIPYRKSHHSSCNILDAIFTWPTASYVRQNIPEETTNIWNCKQQK